VLMDCSASDTAGAGLTTNMMLAGDEVLWPAQGAAAATVAVRLMVCVPGVKGMAAVQVTGTSTLLGWDPARPAGSSSRVHVTTTTNKHTRAHTPTLAASTHANNTTHQQVACSCLLQCWQQIRLTGAQRVPHRQICPTTPLCHGRLPPGPVLAETAVPCSPLQCRNTAGASALGG
jgi:hypothetical protein